MLKSSGRLLAILAAMILLISACGSDGGNETSAEAASPLAEFLGEDLYGFGGDDPEAQARAAEADRKREEKIAACMKAEGFEYIPVDNSQFIFVDEGDDLDYNSREYAEKWGFGYSTQSFSQEQVGPELIGYDDSQFTDEAEEGTPDPNQAYVETLDQSTQEAYWKALYGDEEDFAFDPETMTEEELEELGADFFPEPSGCQAEAWGEQTNREFFIEFSDELEDLYTAVNDDPRLKQQQDKVTECIKTKGFDIPAGVDGFDALFEGIDEDMGKIQEMVYNSDGPAIPDDFDPDSMTEDELDAMFNQEPELSDEAKQLLGEVQAKEIDMAVAMFDCGGSGTDLEDLYREVQAEYEQTFLDQNADRLADFKADPAS